MRGLFGERWIEGVVDYHRRPDQARIEVLAARPVERIEGLYSVHSSRDLAMVWNYLRAIGVRDTLRKVASRRGERLRNAKFVSCGIGRVVEASEGGSLPIGRHVVFLCPMGPACVERLVLPETLLVEVDAGRLPPLPEGTILYDERLLAPERLRLQGLRGWHAEGGEALPADAAKVALEEAARRLLTADWGRSRRLPRSGEAPAPTAAPRRRSTRASRRKRAAVFGYGNYTKTIVLPRVRRHLDVETIHEVDPAQIPLRRGPGIVWDTAPGLAPDERPDAVLVAGYHHSHAPLAAEALRRGASAVIEKPIATTRPQLHELLATMRETGGVVHSGYQRRHLPFNAVLREDLGVGPTEPISYHAMVYEVPLPALHWYRWASSRSRLLSNGCHWIDHFLFLNNFRAPSDYDVRMAPDGTLNCSVVLDNGAFFTMVLTDRGSRRLGVRDYVEVRAGGATARIVDACAYEAEKRSGVVRRARIGRLEAYRRMYDAIGRRIAAGEPGESLLSVQRSASLVLDLEERLDRVREGRSAEAAEAAALQPPRALRFLDALPGSAARVPPAIAPA